MFRICSPSRGIMLSGGDHAPPPSGVCAVPGFIARNAVPCAIAAVLDVALIVAAENWVLVVACTVPLVLAVTAGRPLLARGLLRAFGSFIAPVGYERLNPAGARRKALRGAGRRVLPLPEPAPASYRVRVVKPVAAIPVRHVLRGEVVDSETVRVRRG